MTESKLAMDKKKRKTFGKSKDKMEDKKVKYAQSKKLKQMMKKRLIVRNLSFKVSEDELKKVFSAFGDVLDIKIPVDKAGKKRGFAFVQYKDTNSQIRAMKELNFKEIQGRPIAIDFAIDKTTYQSRQNNIKPPSVSLKSNEMFSKTKSHLDSKDSESEDIKPESKPNTSYDSGTPDEEDTKVKAFLKEFDADEEEQENSKNETSDESSDDMDDAESDNSIKKDDSTSIRSRHFKKKCSVDVSEGKTIFIRNISFKNTEDDVQEIVQEYGETEYCLFCTDPLTDHFKGTAFVKFKEKESADKFIQESSKEPGILLDGRRLICAYALSREELSKQHNGLEKVKDRRNLKLLKCGLITYGSKEAEGVSKTDMAKRAQLENVKKKKLQNVNFFVSDKRLAIHNLPKNINDKELYILFKQAAGKGAIVKEVRVMRDLKKTDAQGIPVSRGFGFVSFTMHEHALKALMELNNNPKIFTPNKRPIVEFSVENKVALQAQERRRDKIKMRNKNKSEQMIYQSKEQHLSPVSLKKMKNKARNLHFQKKMKQNMTSTPSDRMQVTAPRKKQKKSLKGRNRKDVISAEDKNNFHVLTNKYKEKLLNKFS